MKKDKQPSPAKAARKGIQETLVKAIKAIADQLQKKGIHTGIDIEKESKKLAKKITKNASIEAPVATPAEAKETKPTTETKTPAKETASAATKPTATKATKAAVPATKPATPKATKVVAPVATEPPATTPIVKITKASAKKPAAKK